MTETTEQTTLAELESAVVRAAIAWRGREPSVPESMRTLMAAVDRLEAAESVALSAPPVAARQEEGT